MSAIGIWIATALVVAASMELWAAFLHGRVWHHALWRVHRSHHSRRPGRFEANDILSSLHAPIAIAFILYGCMGAPGLLRDLAFGAGIGMTLFGVAYVIEQGRSAPAAVGAQPEHAPDGPPGADGADRGWNGRNLLRWRLLLGSGIVAARYPPYTSCSLASARSGSRAPTSTIVALLGA